MSDSNNSAEKGGLRRLFYTGLAVGTVVGAGIGLGARHLTNGQGAAPEAGVAETFAESDQAAPVGTTPNEP